MNLVDIDSTSREQPLIVMTRTFDAPRAVVWEAFTNPKHIARWFGGHGFVTLECEMDVRPGGLWHHVMRLPDGGELVMNVVFTEVVKPERLVWQDADFGKRERRGHPASIMIEIPLGGPMRLEMNGLELMRDWSLPQFYFHVVTTYAILRHNGVDLGIRDYGSAVGRYIRQ